jgi:hypothetical protein
MIGRLFPFIVVFLTLAASGQDWQDCKPDGDYSFKDVKAAVRRVTTTRMYSGWDEKTFARSGALVAVAVIHTLDDSEMASPEGAKNVLVILRAAFDCPAYCIKVTDDRHPSVTLLLLEHLRQIAGGKMQPEIDDAKKFILQQASKVASVPRE